MHPQPHLPALSADELAFLAEAAEFLDSPSRLMRVANLVGKPAEVLLASLPTSLQEQVAKLTSTGLERGVRWAIASIRRRDRAAVREGAVRARPSLADHTHTALAALTGAGGGFFGLAGLAVDLPATTMLMLRSIATIAAEHGQDLDDPRTRLQCIAVLGLGAGAADDMDSAYFTTRLGLAIAVDRAATYLATHTAREAADALARGTAPVLVRLIQAIAARFQVVLSEKAAVEAVPLVGAAAGALVNAAFTDHFNRVARYHFGILELERRYGPALVEGAYRRALPRGPAAAGAPARLPHDA